LNKYLAALDARPDDAPRIERLFMYFGRLVDLEQTKTILVLGCGPKPNPMRVLLGHGYRVIGVEPVPQFVDCAREYLGDSGFILQGGAEAIPLGQSSVDIVFFESVLEHVDSPLESLQEIFRVLKPGGIAFILTTNRHRLDIRGLNWEFNVPYFNWFPAIVKESFVFKHLHYDPRLANFTERPAVHWFSYAELCALGRTAGFAQFYSLLDLQAIDDPPASGHRTKLRSLVRRVVLNSVRASPWVRALALSQADGDIIMWKRPSSARSLGRR
jgi:SAM-dependent methyltransferase